MRGVSAVIPTHRQRPDLLLDAVTSAVTHASEVIVVVDREQDTDGIENIARVVESPGHGIAAALNRGIDAARCSRIAFLDSDDIWLPGKQHQLAADAPATCTDYTRNGEPVCDRRPMRSMFADNIVCRSTTVIDRDIALAVGGVPDYRWGQDWAFHCSVQLHCGWTRIPVLGSAIRDQPHGHTASADAAARSRCCAKVRREFRRPERHRLYRGRLDG